MKKILSLCLILTMILSLCACGNNSTVEPTNSDKISNDTTITTPPTETTDSSAIEYNPNTKEEPEGFDLSMNYKEIHTIPEYEKLDLGYKMALLGESALKDATFYYYWVELEDSWKHIYDTYGTMFVEVVDAKDNSELSSYYANVRTNSKNTIIYDEFSRDRNVNRDGFIVKIIMQNDGYFEKNTKYNNYAKVEDLGFILHDYGFEKGQVLEVNCEKEDLNLNWPIRNTNGLIVAGDDYYTISEKNLNAKNNGNEYVLSIRLDMLFEQNEIDSLVLGDTFKFYDEKTMELATFPEGATLTTDIEKITESGTMVNLNFTVSNSNGFSNEFLDPLQGCVLEFDLNGQTYCVDTY